MGTLTFSKVIYLLSSNSKYDDTDVVNVPSNKDIKCSLCLYLYNDPVMLARCGHTFCRSCINKWFCHLKSCPLCRKTGTFADIKAPPKELSDTMSDLMLRCKSCDEHKPLSEIEFHEAKCFISKHGRTDEEIEPEQTTSEEKRSEEDISAPTNDEDIGKDEDIGTDENIGKDEDMGENEDIGDYEDIGDDEDSDRHYPGHTLTLSPRVGIFNCYYTNGIYSCASAIKNELMDQIVSQSTQRIMCSLEWYSLLEGGTEFWINLKTFWKLMVREFDIAQTDFNDCIGPINQNEAVARMKSAESLIKCIARKLKRLIVRRSQRYIHFRFNYDRIHDARLLKIYGIFSCYTRVRPLIY